MDSTKLYLAAEHSMTDEEKERFISSVVRHNPRWRGAHVADMLDMLENVDAYVDILEYLFNANAVSIEDGRLFDCAAFCAILVDGVDVPVWERVLNWMTRIESTYNAENVGH